MFKTLIVEDSSHFRQLLKEILITQFPSMDIKLPEESGLELTPKIKTQYPSTTIIILTSYNLPEYREAATQYKADHFLTKGSTNKDQIHQSVQSILSDRRIDNRSSKGENP